MGAITVVDIRHAVEVGDPTRAADLVEAWIDGAWQAWSEQHETVRGRTNEIVARAF